MSTTLIARDDLGRQRASATFQRTWRMNPIYDRREYGYRLAAIEGCDFGSLTFFRELPTGRRGVGIAAPYVWETVS